jgi:ABC-type Fe3+ transport system permease subunit
MAVNEKELGKALLNLDATQLAGVPEIRQTTWKVLERDRRRVRLLTAVTILTWLLAAILVVIGLVGYGFTFPEQAKLITNINAGKLTPAERDEAQRLVLIAFQKGTLLIAFSVAIMAVAALATVVLILVSRRATLRHINAGLVEIGEQLKQLRQPPS